MIEKPQLYARDASLKRHASFQNEMMFQILYGIIIRIKIRINLNCIEVAWKKFEVDDNFINLKKNHEVLR